MMPEYRSWYPVPLLFLQQWNTTGALVGCGCLDGSVTLWDFATRRICAVLRASACTSAISSLCFAHDRPWLACCSHGAKMLLVWDIFTKALLRQLSFDNPVGRVSLSPQSARNVLCC